MKGIHHHYIVGITNNILTSTSKVNDRTSIRALFSEAMHMSHYIMTQILFKFCCKNKLLVSNFILYCTAKILYLLL